MTISHSPPPSTFDAGTKWWRRPAEPGPDGLAVRLRQTREWRGITQRELAYAVRKTQNYISRIESGGSRQPRVDGVKDIAEALKVSWMWLYYGCVFPPELDEDESMLLAVYRALSEEERQVVRRILSGPMKLNGGQPPWGA